MEKISRYQLVLILVWLTLGTGFLVMPSLITQFTTTDGWIAVLSLFVGGMMSAAIAKFHVSKFPTKRGTAALLAMGGRGVGDALAFWYVSVIFLVGSVVAREFSLFVTIASLPYTSETWIAMIGLICICYITYAGIEPFARANEFVVPLAALVVPFLIFMPISLFDLRQLQPVLENGWLPIWRASGVPMFVYGLEFVIAIQFVPNLRSPEKLPKDILIAAAISTVLVTLVVVLVIGVFGTTTRYLQYPVLELVRVVRIGRFIERLDTLYGIAVLTTIIFKLTVLHLALCMGIQDVCRTSGYRWAIIPAGATMFVSGLWFFRNTPELTHFIENVGPSYLLFSVVGIPFIGLCIEYVRSMWRNWIQHD
ncbi:spore germination protein [Alicyclobacillus hesperidum URH17-3-68]|uniref:Germination protein GerKB n=1 Tax=Alicyclobacillus hesperidum TaxID=89784 RepID=A0AA37X4F9_9BACL|nr:endospore germination permease [Alicyclobacillus hesperidum]EJY56362.1 spore germination protein [Alicyclobacillus hesperidum URH17-3-68]GLV14962.1 germination protein GerKB [Alicyclobacillus hesperidum]